MKIINNQDTLLIDELKKNVNSDSNLYICTEYFTSNVIFELFDIINTAGKVNLLVSYNFKLNDEYPPKYSSAPIPLRTTLIPIELLNLQIK